MYFFKKDKSYYFNPFFFGQHQSTNCTHLCGYMLWHNIRMAGAFWNNALNSLFTGPPVFVSIS